MRTLRDTSLKHLGVLLCIGIGIVSGSLNEGCLGAAPVSRLAAQERVQRQAASAPGGRTGAVGLSHCNRGGDMSVPLVDTFPS